MPYPKTKSEIAREYAEKHGIPVVDLPLHEFENQLPEWAVEETDDSVLEVMQQLYTKDSSVRGNATIAKIRYLRHYAEIQFIVATDAGTILKLTVGELFELYKPGKYILKDFPNPLIKERIRGL